MIVIIILTVILCVCCSVAGFILGNVSLKDPTVHKAQEAKTYKPSKDFE